MPTLGLPGPTEAASEQVRRWVEGPVEFWEECERRFGPLVSLNLGSLGPAILVSDPEFVRGIFQLPRDSFEVRHYNEHYRFVMGERSLLVLDGESHRCQKPLLSSSLRREPLLHHGGTIQGFAERMTMAWPVGKPFNPRPHFHDLTFQVIVHLTLGDVTSATGQALLAIYRDSVIPRIGGSWGPWQQFRRLHEEIRRLLADDIAARRADLMIPGILTRLAVDGRDDGAALDDLQICDHVFTLMIAGVDTTALALTWTLHWLTRDDSVRDRLLEEMESADDDSIEALLTRPYLHAVFQETLRMYPIVPTPSGRKLTRDVEIAGRVFPEGVTLIPCPYLVHRREEIYPESGRFRPERFLNKHYESHHYFPFGGGTRTCIGEQLAQIDFKIALCAVLTRWDVASVDLGPVRAVRHGTMLAPSENFQLLVTEKTRVESR